MTGDGLVTSIVTTTMASGRLSRTLKSRHYHTINTTSQHANAALYCDMLNTSDFELAFLFAALENNHLER